MTRMQIAQAIIQSADVASWHMSCLAAKRSRNASWLRDAMVGFAASIRMAIGVSHDVEIQKGEKGALNIVIDGISVPASFYLC